MACKAIPRDPEITQKDLEREFAINQQMNHPNIVSFLKGLYSKHKYYLLFELINGEDMVNFLTNNEEVLSEAQLVDMCLQIVGGLHVIHQSGKLHRDLKFDNVLVQLEKDEKGKIIKITPKICDFGHAKEIMEDVTMTRGRGTAAYSSP